MSESLLRTSGVNFAAGFLLTYDVRVPLSASGAATNNCPPIVFRPRKGSMLGWSRSSQIFASFRYLYWPKSAYRMTMAIGAALQERTSSDFSASSPKRSPSTTHLSATRVTTHDCDLFGDLMVIWRRNQLRTRHPCRSTYPLVQLCDVYFTICSFETRFF